MARRTSIARAALAALSDSRGHSSRALGGFEWVRERALHEGLAGRLQEMVDRAIPDLAVDRVLGERPGVAREPSRIVALHGAEHRRMELPPSIVKQFGVGDLVRQRVPLRR
jgi:hypothetical protein